MKSRSPLQKVEGLKRLVRLGLPTTEYRIHPPLLMDRPPGPIPYFIAKYGSVSIRTDSEYARGGGSPFLFMETSALKAFEFLDKHKLYWRIICEAVKPCDVLVQAHVGLREENGYWKLWGEANDTCVASCRQAVALGTPGNGLKDIWAFEDYRPFWARLRRLMLDAGLVNGELAEVTIKKDGRLVFWEV